MQRRDAQSAALVTGAGALVRVPHPARFALHKLVVATSRPAAMQAKRDKDLRQAAQLIEVLAEDRPGDLARARRAADARGERWGRALRSAVTACGASPKPPRMPWMQPRAVRSRDVGAARPSALVAELAATAGRHRRPARWRASEGADGNRRRLGPVDLLRRGRH
jgi:hypothetical protein